jgi:hypothetical protein
MGYLSAYVEPYKGCVCNHSPGGHSHNGKPGRCEHCACPAFIESAARFRYTIWFHGILLAEGIREDLREAQRCAVIDGDRVDQRIRVAVQPLSIQRRGT